MVNKIKSNEPLEDKYLSRNCESQEGQETSALENLIDYYPRC